MVLKSLNVKESDNLTIKEFLKGFGSEGFVDLLLFSSKLQWFKVTLRIMTALFSVAGLFIFAVDFIHEAFCHTHGWTVVFILPFIPFCLLIPAFVLSYYSSFVLPKKIQRKISKFTDKYLPEMSKWNDMPLTKHIVKHNNQCVFRNFCVALNMKKHERKLGKDFIAFKLPYGVTDFSLINSEGQFTKEFCDLWNTYTNGKETCLHIVPEPFAFVAIFSISEPLDNDIVRRTMDELTYLPTKFNVTTIPEEKLQGF